MRPRTSIIRAGRRPPARGAQRRPAGGGARAPHRRRRKPQPIPAARPARQRVATSARAAPLATPARGRTSPPGGLWGRRAGPCATRRAGRRAMARRREAARGLAPTGRPPRDPATPERFARSAPIRPPRPPRLARRARGALDRRDVGRERRHAAEIHPARDRRRRRGLQVP